jgi:hypothetical protein
MNRTDIISEHIALLKHLDIKPTEAMASLSATVFHHHQNHTWGDVRTEIEKWYRARAEAQERAEMVATENIKVTPAEKVR